MNATPVITVYRRLGALLFEEAAQATGLAPGALGARLREELSRPTLTAPTLRSWRRGDKAVPLAAFLATCRIAKVRPLAMVTRVSGRARAELGGDDLVELLLELAAAAPATTARE